MILETPVKLSVEKSIVKDISWNSLRKDENFGFVLQKVKKGAILSKARNKKYRILRNGEVLAVSNEEDEILADWEKLVRQAWATVGASFQEDMQQRKKRKSRKKEKRGSKIKHRDSKASAAPSPMAASAKAEHSRESPRESPRESTRSQSSHSDDMVVSIEGKDSGADVFRQSMDRLSVSEMLTDAGGSFKRLNGDDGFVNVDDSRKITDIYEMKEQLGKGSFAAVRRATHKATGKDYAVKIISKKDCKDHDLQQMAKELYILSMLDHPNIVNMVDVYETDDSLYIVMELMHGGMLFDRIVEKEEYSEAEAKKVIRGLCEALKYLHSKGIVHRDLKAENLLLPFQDDDTNIKVADFGLSNVVEGSKMLQTCCGSPHYVAPEVLRCEPYGEEVDMWSVGVIAFVLLCGFPPFNDDNIPTLFDKVLEGKYSYPSGDWIHISNTSKEFIDRLLVKNPKERMSAAAALEHKWLKTTSMSSSSSITLSHTIKNLKEWQEKQDRVGY